MLGILLIYWIGRYYYRLAIEYGKQKWNFAILGVAIYIVTLFSFGFLLGIIAEIASPGWIDTINDKMLDIAMTPLGLLGTYLFYKYLERKWKRERPVNDIEDIGNEINQY